MDVRLIPMRALDNLLRAGAHSSDGWDVDTFWHKHDMHQLLYAFDGAVEVEGRAARYKVPRQFAMWIPAGTVHRTRIQKVPSGSVFLSADMVDSPAGDPRVIVAPRVMREMIIHAMRWPFDRVADDVSTIYFDCFAKLCSEWISAEVPIALPASTDQRIAAILDFTSAHIAQVSLVDVCQAVGMSERSLRRHFRAGVGMTWEEYRQRLRIYLAIEALDRGDRSVGSIAADVGYESPAAFAKMFRTVMGIGPSDYRKSAR